MIDGYSVQEAASVLGVPEGRVWELLARGVISGTPEGDSMRVFLKAQSGPIATAGSPPSEEPRTNGNGGSHPPSTEASAFRELLTEFRNLTERYGQALLALGEARGEVAGLRGRIDTLEARLDLRLPAPRDSEPVAWEAPVPPAATSTSRAATRAPKTAVRSGKARTPKPIRRTPRSRKAATVESAVAGFADALARAQDPGVAGVGTTEATSEFDAMPFLTEPLTEPLADEALPAEALPADPLPTADDAPAGSEFEAPGLDVAEEPLAADEAIAAATAPEVDALLEPAAGVSQYSADVVEPDWFADGDFAWLDVAEIEARTAPVGAPAAPAAPAVTAGPEAEPEVATEPEAALDALAAFEAEQAPDDEVAVDAAEPELQPEPLAYSSQSAAEPEEMAQPDAAIVEEEAEEYDADTAETAAATAPAAETESDAGPDLDAEFAIDLEAEAAPIPAIKSELPDEPAPSASRPITTERSVEPDHGAGLEAVSMVEAPPQSGPEPWAKPPEARGFSPNPHAGEEELMWLGDRRPAAGGAASEMETAPRWRPGQVATPERWDPPAPSTWPEADRGAREETRDLALTDDELARLARTEGWDASQVAAIRAMIRPSTARNFELPGAADLDEAMAELQAPPAGSTAAGAAQRQWTKPPPARDEPVAREEWAYESEPPPPRPQPVEPNPPVRKASPDAFRARSRRGPAATAYRRLRRLFPG